MADPVTRVPPYTFALGDAGTGGAPRYARPLYGPVNADGLRPLMGWIAATDPAVMERFCAMLVYADAHMPKA